VKHFEKFAHRQIRLLISHLKKYERTSDSEILHRIRVDIKKIKAVLEAMGYCKKHFKAHRNFIPFRNIFRRADEIREPEVLIQLLLQYTIKGIDDDRIFDNRENLIAAFNTDIPYFIKMVKTRANKLGDFFSEVHGDDFKRYLRKKKKEVKSQLFPKPRMRTIHKVRKAIKAIIYLSEVQSYLKKKEAKFYAKIESTIGRLHDKQVLLLLLKNQNSDAVRAQSEVIQSECLVDAKEILRLITGYYG